MKDKVKEKVFANIHTAIGKAPSSKLESPDFSPVPLYEFKETARKGAQANIDAIRSRYDIKRVNGVLLAVDAVTQAKEFPVEFLPMLSSPDTRLIITIKGSGNTPGGTKTQGKKKEPVKGEGASPGENPAPSDTIRQEETKGTPPPKEKEVVGALSKAIGTLFSGSKVEQVLVEHLLNKLQGNEKEKRIKELLAAVDSPEGSDLRKNVMAAWKADIKSELDDLFKNADLKDRDWLVKTDPGLANLLATKECSAGRKCDQTDLLKHYCLMLPAPTATQEQPKVSAKDQLDKEATGAENIKAAGTGEEAKALSSQSFDAMVNIYAACQDMFNQEKVKKALEETKDPASNQGLGADLGSTEVPAVDTKVVTPKTTADNESQSTQTKVSSNMLRNIGGAAFGAVALGLFGVAAFGGPGLVLGALIGAAVGAAVVHFTNNPIGAKK